MVPILDQVSTSENSNFIILAFDVIQNNPMIRTHIELNEAKTKMESVTLTFTDLHNLRVTFTFEGRTLIAHANELFNALRYHIISKKANPQRGIPLKSAGQSLTDFLDRLITGHLAQHPEEASMLKADPAVKEIDYFGRNPEKDPDTNKEDTRLHNQSTLTPIKGAGSVAGSEVGNAARGGGGFISGGGSAGEDEDYITVETTTLTTPMTKWGGPKEAQVNRRFIELRDAGRPIRIFMDDFKWFTYWIRHAPERDHMEVTLRAAIKIAKETNKKSKNDKLMYMGSQWKMEPNMATWHDALEQEGSEHTCYRLSITPEDYKPNGYVYLDRDTRARMTVFLYYGHKEAESPEERNEYKRIYCKWHPQ